jgi:hypothetical protein
MAAIAAAGGIDMRPTALIVSAHADDADALAALVEATGFRVLAALAPDVAADRLARIVAVDLVLVRADAALAEDHRLLTALDARTAGHDSRIVALGTVATLDGLYAALPSDGTEILCDAAPLELAATLMALRAREARAERATLQDINGENDSARLRDLSVEVRRLAAMIERIGQTGLALDEERDANDPFRARALWDRNEGYAGETLMIEADDWTQARPPAAIPPVRLGEIRQLLRNRRRRDQFLPGDIFADPAWDMLLDLMAARIEGKRVSVSSLCIAAAVPPTTALRWIKLLTQRGLFVREEDQYDRRRVFIALSDSAAASLGQWFAAARADGMQFAPARRRAG